MITKLNSSRAEGASSSTSWLRSTTIPLPLSPPAMACSKLKHKRTRARVSSQRIMKRSYWTLVSVSRPPTVSPTSAPSPPPPPAPAHVSRLAQIYYLADLTRLYSGGLPRFAATSSPDLKVSICAYSHPFTDIRPHLTYQAPFFNITEDAARFCIALEASHVRARCAIRLDGEALR